MTAQYRHALERTLAPLLDLTGIHKVLPIYFTCSRFTSGPFSRSMSQMKREYQTHIGRTDDDELQFTDESLSSRLEDLMRILPNGNNSAGRVIIIMTLGEWFSLETATEFATTIATGQSRGRTVKGLSDSPTQAHMLIFGDPKALDMFQSGVELDIRRRTQQLSRAFEQHGIRSGALTYNFVLHANCEASPKQIRQRYYISRYW